MGRQVKYSDEVVAALLWHFTPYSVEQTLGLKWGRVKTITPVKDDALIDEFLDLPTLRRRRLEWSEMMDLLILRERGYTDREISRHLSFSTHGHGTTEEVIARIQEHGYSVPTKDIEVFNG